MLTAYVNDAAPLWDAILEGDHARLTAALSANAALYAKWVAFLEQWTRRLDAAAARVEIAHTVWDGLLASMAAIETAGALADLAASATPRAGGPIAALAGGSSAVLVDAATLAETMAALRHLIATGALDAAFVAALARMGSTTTPPASLAFQMGKASPPKLGGAYKDVAGAGGEAHHCPSKAVSPLPEPEGPAVRVDPLDHRQTTSYGRSAEARAWRATQQRLILEGRFREAQQMDVDELRRRFGSKYEEGIKQMLEYTDTIPASRLVPK